VKARFDGTFPLACPSRDFCDIQILGKTEHDHDPVIGTQAGDDLPKSVILAAYFAGSEVDPRNDCLASCRSAPAKAIAANVDNDAVEPGVEPTLVPESRPACPGLHGGVMDGVLGLRVSGKNRRRQSVGTVQSRLGQTIEGLSSVSQLRIS